MRAGSKIIGITMVKNERDIVEPFVRHNLAHVDALLIYDDGSTDGTVEVLDFLAKEGLPIHVTRGHGVGDYQAERMTDLARRAAEDADAEWVVCLDADELIEVDDGRVLRDVLASSSHDVHEWMLDFFATSERDDASETNPAKRLTRRVTNYPYPWMKVIVRASLLREPDVRIVLGNHAVARGDAPIPATPVAAGRLAHFAVRSTGQYAQKSVIGYLQFTARGGWTKDLAFQRVAPFEMVARDFAELERALHVEAARFSVPRHLAGFVPVLEDRPLAYLGGELRCPIVTPCERRFVSNFAMYAEELARALGFLRFDHADALRAKEQLEASRVVLDEALLRERAARHADVRALEDELARLRDRASEAERKLAELEATSTFKVRRVYRRGRKRVREIARDLLR